MKSKRITAMILTLAMVIMMLPNSIAFARPTNGSPELKIALYTQDSSLPDGDDLVRGGDSIYDIGKGGVFQSAETEIDADTWQNEDVIAKELLPATKRMAISIKAESQGNGFGTGHKLWDKSAVQYTYLDLDKNPIYENEDGSMSNVASASAVLDADNIQWHYYTELATYSGTIDEFNKDENVRYSKVAAVNQQLVDDKGLEVVIWNIIKKEFSGYLRVKVVDLDGKTTYQDVLVIADGNYPEIEVSSATDKNKIGEVELATYDVQIDGRKFKSAKTVAITEVNSDWKNDSDTVSDDDMREAIKKMIEGRDGEVAHNYWATDDITLSIKAYDTEMSSELKSLSWEVYNYPNVINLMPMSGTKVIEGEIVLPTYKDGGNIDAVDAGTNDLHKKEINAADYVPTNTSGYPATATGELVIPATAEGMNILVVTAQDVAGLTSTNYYYYFIDSTAPNANYTLVELGEQVIQLFSDADTVTKWQQGLDMTASEDVADAAQLISNIDTEDEDVYQYRLLARDYSVAEADIDLNTVDADGVPYGYTAAAPTNTALTYGKWLDWTLKTEDAVINEEFDGLIQVRVQDKAGNWSVVTDDEEESVIADNTDAVLAFEAFELEDFNGSSLFAESILTTGANIIENRETKWIKDSALLWAQVTDENLQNQIRSSGLFDGTIQIDVDFNDENEGKKAILYGFDASGDRDAANDFTFDGDSSIVLDNTNIDKYCFAGTGTLDKQLGFMIQYDGTGTADVKFTITDKAGNVLDYTSEYDYNVRLKVDKINPIATFKGYDETDAAMAELLKPNTGAAVDYEDRNMPWGPNSQVLEVKVVDNDLTPIQSGLINGVLKIKSDKNLVIKNQKGGSNLTVIAGNEATISSDYLVENIENLDYTFFAVYEGTGIAKIEVYAEDEAENVRDYPTVSGAANYDAMLRVDKINPEIRAAELVQTDADVNDGFILFTVNETEVDVNTRKQMKLYFEVYDDVSTQEQSGVNLQNEELAGVELTEVKAKYVEQDKTHLYDEEAKTYATDLNTNDEAVDPNIDYILLPVEVGAIDGLGGTFTDPASTSNDDIENLVNKYINKYSVAWEKASWTDGAIVVPDEFQGAIVLRTIDRVGNIDYSMPITFAAESRDALIDFDPQNGYIWSQNNYGWSKRDYDYVEIRIKDDNEEKVDAWLENIFINVTDLDGNDITINDSVKFARNIDENNPAEEFDPSTLQYDSLNKFAYEPLYGYDVIDGDLVETIARDDEGYIHIGYVRVTESAKINVTVFDKAMHNDTPYTGNKTTGTWVSRIDRVAPVVTEFDLVPVYEGAGEDKNNNGFALKIKAEDALSGIAPDITDAQNYNVYTPENGSFLYQLKNDDDKVTYTYNSGTFNADQYELPGIQYALIPGNGYIEEVAPWNFEEDPNAIYVEGGYNGEMGKTYVWHNYVDENTPMLPVDFDGLIVVRAVDKAGNITVVGYSAILDVEADDDWNKETQFIQVRTDNKWEDGVIENVQYYGNNNLLFPADMRKDLSPLKDNEGSIIEVVEQGITNVVITATEKFTAPQKKQANTADRNATYEGEMNLGNYTAAGTFEDRKFQVVDVKIDKINPEMEFKLIDKDGKEIEENAVEGIVEIKLTKLSDPIPNLPDELGYRSHIPSDIAKVEWCAVPEGSSQEKWIDVKDWSVDKIGEFNADAFTGTIKVRVTDNAKNVTVKSQRVNVDGVQAIINMSKSHDDIYSTEPVDVFVTVTENAEFSDVAEVVYEVTDEKGAVVEEDALTLVGGTVSVDREGTTTVKVTAKTKAGITAEKEIEVKIDRTAPTFKLNVEDKSGSVENRTTNENVNIFATEVEDKISGVAKVEYAIIPEGSAEENYNELNNKYEFKVDEAFTGTVKVRVTDNAGIETVKSMKINIDKKAPLVVISKSNEKDYSKENVNVFVTVTENAEFSDVAEVVYEITDEKGAVVEEDALALVGGTVSVDREGTTTVKVTAKTKAGVSATATTTVLIDKTAPEFKLHVIELIDSKNNETGNSVADAATQYDVRVTIDNLVEKISGVKSVEWCKTAEGYSDEKWDAAEDWENGKIGDVYANAFSGTIKVRVTDNAGHVTVKSQKINIDKDEPIVIISKSNEEKCSKEPVNVFVTVTENEEFSDVVSVTYTEDGGEEKKLSLTGGTISVTKDGETEIIVTAETKAGKKATAKTTVLIHYNDLEMPTIKGTIHKDGEDKADQLITSGDWVVSDKLTLVNNETKFTDAVVWYSLNGEEWKTNSTNNPIVTLKPGQNTLRIQTKTLKNGCGCESDVNTYVVNYDNGEPTVSIDHDYGIRRVTVGDKEFNTLSTTNGTKVIDITPNKGTAKSEIASVIYTIVKDGSAMREDKNLPISGGSIVFDEEGKWGICDIVVTMESGKKFTFFDSNLDETDIVAVIDKTPPVIDIAKTTKGVSLFGLAEPTNTKLGVEVKATESVINEIVDNKAIIVYEYALVEKGMIEPSWNSLGVAYSGDTITKADIIEKAFEGSILIKASDLAGNSVIKSIPVLTEGEKPQISITAPSNWQTNDIMIDVDVVDPGLTSSIKTVEVKYYDAITGDPLTKAQVGKESLTVAGGSIEITREGQTKVVITATDASGNSSDDSISSVIVKLDKTAPEYSKMIELLGVYNEHMIPESDWDVIHDNWTYNHDVSIDGITDDYSGIKKVHVKFTSKEGEVTETTLKGSQTNTSFSSSGKYVLTMVDNAGNVRIINFAIDKDLKNVINVVGVDEVGKLYVHVTDGGEDLTFFSKGVESTDRYEKLYNGITNQFIDGRTGTRYIYGQNDSGKKTNTLYVIVAPSAEYDVTVMNLGDAPNRYVDVDGTSVEAVTRVKEVKLGDVNVGVDVEEVTSINVDGVYTITTK